MERLESTRLNIILIMKNPPSCEAPQLQHHKYLKSVNLFSRALRSRGKILGTVSRGDWNAISSGRRPWLGRGEREPFR